jgi:hypothetical protein
MNRSVLLPILGIISLPISAPAQNAKVQQGPAPKWVLAPPKAAAEAPGKDALLQINYIDNEVRVTKKGQDNYVAQRFKILKPEALQLSNLRFLWRPSSGGLVVHSIRLHRQDGTSTEMLGKADFQIIQREENLEQSMLTGLMTAVFAIPGVEVGDEIEFAVTITNFDPTLGSTTSGLLQLPLAETPGAFRVRLLQSDGLPLTKRTTPDLADPALSVTRTDKELVVELNNPKSANIPEGAPGRFGIRRQVEYTSFNDWPAVSATFWTHFEQASHLAPNSPVRAEIAKIAATSSDPQARALAALKLVQDRVRYVFVGLGTGNYTPASADQTWDRRYGDCKGKTALLLAILRELGISAEAVLVNQSGVDGIAERLPSPGHFDHVLVRTTLGDASYWLDGTLFNSPSLAYIPQPVFLTALPLSKSGSKLEVIKPQPLELPEEVGLIDIDASAGPDKPSRVSIRKMSNGRDVGRLRTALASLAGDDLKRGLRQLANEDGANAESEESSWDYDGKTGTLTIKWAGTKILDWDKDDPQEPTYYLPGAGFSPPDALKRPKEQDQTAPWSVTFPTFKCWVTTITLPADDARTQWDYHADPVGRTLAGVEYFRSASVNGNTLQTVMSKRSVKPQLTAEEAAGIESALAGFDNSKSYVFRHKRDRKASVAPDDMLVKSATLDWLSTRKLYQLPVK